MMKISVKVKPRAKEDKVKKIGPHRYAVWVKAKPIEGKANQAAVKILSEYFDIARSKITLIKGKKTTDKIFQLRGCPCEGR